MPRYTRRRLPKRSFRGGSIMSWIRNKALPWIRNTALPYVKKNRLITRGLQMIPHPYAQTASKVSNALGYGRRRGGALRMAGGALYM